MPQETISLLLIEDDPIDADLFQEILDDAENSNFIITWVQRLQVALEKLDQEYFDLILSDLSLPDSHGPETFIRLNAHSPHLPIVVLSGSDDETLAVKALQEGAQDYLVKGKANGSLIIRSLRYAIERKQAQQALQASEERYTLTARGANDGLWDWHLDLNIAFFSSRWKAMLGFGEDEMNDHISEWFKRVHPGDYKSLLQAVGDHIIGKTPHLESEYRIRHKDGRYLWVLCRGLAVRKPNGRAYRIAGSQTDITRRHIAEQKLKHDALHDTLTRLPNRTLFTDRLTTAIHKHQNESSYNFAVLFLDLDRFKVINDSLGHLVGDKLLISATRRLRSCLRTNDTLARFGGDEFVILLNTFEDTQTVEQIANTIHRELEQPFIIDGHHLFTSASIGIAVGSRRYDQPEDMLRDADTAMYAAKAGGRARHVIFEMGQFKMALARLSMENSLRQALDNDEMFIFYQPFVSLKTGQIVGAEALLRWQHPEYGLLMPKDFIPLAEETGLILPLGQWLLRNATRQLSQWHASGFTSLRIAVNVSTPQIRDEDLITLVQEVLEETAVPPYSLELEITEVTAVENNSHHISVLNRLHNLGVSISMDDFGLDSSLNCLKKLPVDTLKIDQSFVHGMDQDGRDQAIIKAIIAMSRSLGIRVIVEGVENEDQLIFLHGEYCDEIQGFLFSHPVPAKFMTELLESKDIYHLRLNKTHDSLAASIQDQAAQGVSYALVDEFLTIVTSNPPMAPWSAVRGRTVEGLPLSDVFPELVGTEQTLLNLIHQQPDDPIEPSRIYHQIYRSSNDSFGRYFDLRIETFQGAANTLLVIVTDITDKARLESMLQQERNDLRLLMAKYKEVEEKLNSR